jgi:hypothetical protein
MCALTVSIVVDSFSLYSDDSGPISIRTTSSGKIMEISFPSKEDSYKKMMNEK